MNQQNIRPSAALQTIAIIYMLGLAGISFAQDDAESLAKAAQNPLASMISLPFQNNTNFDYGPEDGTQNVLNIQPVWPFKLNDDWNLITRTILPVMSVPALTPGGSRTTGLGDTTFTGGFRRPLPASGSGEPARYWFCQPAATMNLAAVSGLPELL